MTEQAAQDPTTDDWSAAMAEQKSAAGKPAPSAMRQPAFEQLAPSAQGPAAPHDIGLVLDIPVQLTVELGRTRIPIRQVLGLAQGSVIELDGVAGEPMRVLVNGCLIAQGEIVVVNEKFGVRLTDIISPGERVRRAGLG